MRKLNEIAKEIESDWKNVHLAARPYLRVMLNLETIEDNFYLDSGKSIVIYFLSNAAGWRGPTAKRIKAELKEMVK